MAGGGEEGTEILQRNARIKKNGRRSRVSMNHPESPPSHPVCARIRRGTESVLISVDTGDDGTD